ncbi:hypothetical protein ASPCADRAFT_9357 [Aspergillus carbonarius ITEM 5010]|uniref:F-box domain-containing protein n=1 Tax=Aspergillus carbonarius (strain ITEM 5010) TaxID=602072 RepID=A0A1R3RBU2_ASPC5|nr:hypothetical protein ASPCADRAFT_9357 [Aspergillus carbonarius ITEM 5010]
MSNSVEGFRNLIKQHHENRTSHIEDGKEPRPTTPLEGVFPETCLVVQKVIGITELLVMILSHLPFRTLLHAQRVCRYFKAVIEESPELRRALFLEAPRETGLEAPRLNPFLQQILCPGSACELMANCVHQSGSLPDLPWYNSPTLRNAVTYKGASWRRMLPSNIPCAVQEATIAPARQEETSWLAERANIREEFSAVSLEGLWDILVAYLVYFNGTKYVLTWTVVDGPQKPRWRISIGEPQHGNTPSEAMAEKYIELSSRTLQEFLDEDPDRRVEWYKSMLNEWPQVVQW